MILLDHLTKAQRYDAPVCGMWSYRIGRLAALRLLELLVTDATRRLTPVGRGFGWGATKPPENVETRSSPVMGRGGAAGWRDPMSPTSPTPPLAPAAPTPIPWRWRPVVVLAVSPFAAHTSGTTAHLSLTVQTWAEARPEIDVNMKHFSHFSKVVTLKICTEGFMCMDRCFLGEKHANKFCKWMLFHK